MDFIRTQCRQYSIICLQETGIVKREEAESMQYRLKKLSQYSSFWSLGTLSEKNGRSGGVGIIIHPQFIEKYQDAQIHKARCNKHYLRVSLNTDEGQVHLHGIYAPVVMADRVKFFDEMECDFPENDHHYLMGDFNEVVNPYLDEINTPEAISEGTRAYRQWTTAIGVVDCWRMMHPADKEYTNPIRLGCRTRRIDYIWVTQGLAIANLRKATHVETLGLGDHAGLSITLQSDNTDSKPSPWRMKQDTLHLPRIRKRIWKNVERFGEYLHSHESLTPGQIIHKYDEFVRKQVIIVKQQQRSDTHRFKAKKRLMESHYRNAAKLLQINPSVGNWRKYQQAKSKLKYWFTNPQHTTHMERLESYVKQQERGTKQFLRPPIRPLPNPAKTGVYMDDGSVSSRMEDMIAQYEKTWGSVFADPKFTTDIPKHIAADTVIDFPEGLSSLDTESAERLDKPLTVYEIEEGIISLSPHKSPGKDGIINEFYQIHPRGFAQILVKVFNASLHRGKLRKTQREGIVSLLYKAGDKLVPANYRPITLMGAEVKILTRILNKRLTEFLPDLIHSDQKGFIPDRNIHDCVNMFQEIQHYLKTADKPGYAMLVDFKKAYDRVNIDYLLRVLEVMNFGDQFRQWIRTIYADNELYLNINGYLSTAIHPGSGVKQGDPISPSLFAIVLEPLLQALRNERDKWGIPLPNHQAKIVEAFADDVTTYAQSQKGILRQQQIIRQYGVWSNAELNMNKTYIICLNPAFPDEHNENQLQILPSHSSTRLLGIYVGSQDTNQENRIRVENRMLKRLNQWHVRGSTMQGRHIIAQAMIISVGRYFFHHIKVGDKFIQKWQKILDSYISGSFRGVARRRRLTGAWMQAPKKEGGLGSPIIRNIINATALSQFPPWRICQDKGGPADIMSLQYFNSVGHLSMTKFVNMLQSPTQKNRSESAVLTTFREGLKVWCSLPISLKIEQTDKYQRSNLWHLNLWEIQHPLWYITSQREVQTLEQYINNDYIPQLLKDYDINALIDIVNLLNLDRWGSAQIWTDKWRATTLTPYVNDEDLHRLYQGLTHIVTHLNNSTGHPSFSVPPHRQCHALQWEIQFTTQKVSLHAVSNKDVQGLLQRNDPKPAHPLTKWTFPMTVQIQSIMQNRSKTNKALLKDVKPQLQDFLTRLQMRMLTLGYRWGKSDRRQSQCILCNLQISETSTHLFWACTFAQNIWTNIRNAWTQVFGGTLEWHNVIAPETVTQHLAPAWKETIHLQAINQLWAIISQATAYQIWLHRNEVRFQHITKPNLEIATNRSQQQMWANLGLWLSKNYDIVTQHVFYSWVDAANRFQLGWQKHRSLAEWITKQTNRPQLHKPIKWVTEVRIRFDGGALGNPGIAGSGWTLDIPAPDQGTREIAWGYRHIGNQHTNNEAEYVGMIEGLRTAYYLGFRSVLLEGDSNIILHQIQSIWRSREHYCEHYKRYGLTYLKRFQSVQLNHIHREYNSRADELSKKAMYNQTHQRSPNTQNLGHIRLFAQCIYLDIRNCTCPIDI